MSINNIQFKIEIYRETKKSLKEFLNYILVVLMCICIILILIVFLSNKYICTNLQVFIKTEKYVVMNYCDLIIVIE